MGTQRIPIVIFATWASSLPRCLPTRIRRPFFEEAIGEYVMPARMWCSGIHPFLELLRHRFPASKERTLTFILLAYSMITLLLESVPAFNGIWIDCLGDLACYQMAVEVFDLEVCKKWTDVARMYRWLWLGHKLAKVCSISSQYVNGNH